MTAWKTLKTSMTKGTTPNTCGYQVEVGKAATAFVALRDYLKNWEDEEKAFNADKDVTEAIIHRKDFIALGLIHE